MVRHATLTEKDIDQIKRCRRSHNRIGFAYQIGFVRLKNRSPIQQPLEIVLDLTNYAGVQLNIEPDEIHRYALRQQTISEHQIRIRQYLNLKELVHADITSLERYIFQQSCRLEKTAALYSLVEQYLRDNKILQPADSTLQRMIGVTLDIHLKLGVLIPAESALFQNYPNPFNPETWIPFHLSQESDVSIRIYDASGRLIRNLSLGYKPEGIYVDKGKAIYWDGMNDSGESVASGIYFYSIQAGDFTATRKMTATK